jgi:alpha-methylacyl-CoA racemase
MRYHKLYSSSVQSTVGVVTQRATGPLAGVRVVELAGIGPAPFCAMLLSDMGADVIRVDRPGQAQDQTPDQAPDPVASAHDVLLRGRRSVVLDLRAPDGIRAALDLAERADVLIEGFRPGVTERLGIGPDDCWARNPKLVYGRMTGWGQDGPLARSAGHDISYLAITGTLHAIGRPGQPPTVPMNVVGDFGGGALYLATGILAALLETQRSGRGQVVDAAIVDGAASLTAMAHGMLAAGMWRDEPGVNLLDGGVPWYDVYATADGQWVAVGALEDKFFAEFTRLLGLDNATRTDPGLRDAIAAAFATRTRAQWAEVFEGSDACVAPVLGLTEAPDHPHLTARGTFVDVAGIRQPGPAPRFSRTPSAVQGPRAKPGAHTREALLDWGVPGVDALIESGAAIVG